MTELERLEGIIDRYMDVEHDFNLNKDDTDWLITMASMYIETRDDAFELYDNNKRYRQALEFYADIGNYDEYEDRKLGLIVDVLEESGEKARKALEESK